MFNNSRILVVGAGGLLGSNLVAELVRRGAKPIAADLDTKRAAERISELAPDISMELIEFRELNVCEEQSVKDLFLQLSGVVGIVNCSYPRGKHYGKSFRDVTLESFNENVSLHLGSAFLLMREAAEYFLRNQTPLSVVNISSIYGVVAPKFDIYAGTKMTMPVEYSAIKSATLQLTKYVASYVKNSKFRVNCVSPGGVEDGQPEMFLNSYRKHTLGKGMLDAEDVVGSVIFLLSDLSNFVNGQNIVVDDGFTL